MATKNTNYIFLVDDEPIQNEMLKDFIASRFDYTIKTFESGEDAISEINLNPDIVVLDFHLHAGKPNTQNGVEVLRKIKQLLPHTQVIMLSGQDKLEVAADSMKYGAYDYIVKGETSFSRMENILNNINELRRLKKANKTFRLLSGTLGIAIVLVLIFSYYLAHKLDVSLPAK